MAGMTEKFITFYSGSVMWYSVSQNPGPYPGCAG